MIGVGKARPVGHESSSVDKLLLNEHRWQTTSCDKVQDSVSIAVEQRIWGYNESRGAFCFHPRQHSVKFARFLCLKKIELYTQRSASSLHFSQKDLSERMSRISKDRYPRKLRGGLLEQLDPFPAESFADGQCDSREVAARPGEAIDDAITYGVGHCRKNHRSHDSRMFRRESTGRGADDQNVYFKLAQLRDQMREAFG